MKHDYSYYWTHNVSISTSGNYNTRGLKYCIEEIGLDRCMYAIGTLLHTPLHESTTNICRHAVRDGRGSPELVEDGRPACGPERGCGKDKRYQVVQTAIGSVEVAESAIACTISKHTSCPNKCKYYVIIHVLNLY
jgi:hypothetical protein